MRFQQVIPDLHIHEPQNELEELMMLVGEKLPDNRAEIAEIVMDCIDQLPEQSRDLINALFYEQCSYRELGRKVGHSHVHVWRLMRVAFDELKVLLLQHELIKELYEK